MDGVRRRLLVDASEVATVAARMALFTRLTAVVGIANDADGVSSALEATVVVKIDGAEAKRETITVVNPLHLDQNVADVGRVELFFIAGGDVPVVIAELTGHQG